MEKRSPRGRPYRPRQILAGSSRCGSHESGALLGSRPRQPYNRDPSYQRCHELRAHLRDQDVHTGDDRAFAELPHVQFVHRNHAIDSLDRVSDVVE